MGCKNLYNLYCQNENLTAPCKYFGEKPRKPLRIGYNYVSCPLMVAQIEISV